MESQLVMLSPESLVSDNNIRFALRPSRINSLAADILDKGGVMVPLEIEPLAEPINGAAYRITEGAYRHAAVAQLNKGGATFELPCVVVENDSLITRAKRQLSENMERQDMTPMDIGFAVRKMLDLGVSRAEVRAMFPREAGRKGTKVAPASNSFINMMMSFLDFPKTIQSKIHNGELGVGAAYQLTKADPTKWNDIIARVEEDRRKAFEQEDKDEEKYLADIKKQEDTKAKLETMEKEAAEAKVKAAEVMAKVDATAKAEADAYTIKKQAKSKEEKEAAEAAFKDREDANKMAIMEADKAKKEADKLAAKLESNRQKALESLNKLKADKKLAKDKGKTTKAASGKDVQKAATAVGAPIGTVQLKISELRAVITEGALPSSQPKVQAIFIALKKCADGVTTPKQLYKDIAKVTGETKAKEVKAE